MESILKHTICKKQMPSSYRRQLIRSSLYTVRFKFLLDTLPMTHNTYNNNDLRDDLTKQSPDW